MKLLILGATGPTGRHIVEQALGRGHEATALVRSPKKAADLTGVKLVVSDARDEMSLRQAVAGQDAVISALGTPVSPFKEVSTLSTSTRALVSAMKAENVARLVCITGMGSGDSAGHGGFAFDNLILPILLRKVYADKNRQEAIVRESGLEWVLVRPAVLNNKPAQGTYRELVDLSKFQGGTISRADVAGFMLDQASTPTWLHRAPLIAW